MPLTRIKKHPLEWLFIGLTTLAFITMVGLSVIWFSGTTPVLVVDEAKNSAHREYAVKAGDVLAIPRRYCVIEQPPVDGWNVRTLTDVRGEVKMRLEVAVNKTSVLEGCYERVTTMLIPKVMPPGKYTHTTVTTYRMSPITTFTFQFEPETVIILPANYADLKPTTPPPITVDTNESK